MRLLNRLKEIRLQKGWTQEGLARMAGVTRQTVIAIEKSKFVPSVKLALEISAILEVSLDEIFRLEPDQGAKNE